MTISVERPIQRAGEVEISDLERRKFNVVHIWAFFGVVTLGIIAWTWGTWLFGGHATPTSPGPVEPPGWMTFGIRAMEAVSVITGAVVGWFVIIRPWIRHRRLSFDGMISIGMLTCWMWQDVLFNYNQTWFIYNAKFTNLGCPQCWVPGWQAQNQTQAEPLLWAAAWYFAFAWVVIVGVNWLMARARRRWPRLGNLGLFMGMWAVGMVVDFLIEIPYLKLGWYTIAGADRSQSLFAGHYYQFPLHENVIGGLYLGTWAAIRFFRNDKGQPIHEKGIDEVRASEKTRQKIKVLAMIGAFNVAQFVTFNVPTYMFTNHADPWPDDVLKRSYFTQEVCGPGTDYACPDKRVPLSRGPASAHLTPDGRFVTPAGFPDQIPDGMERKE